MNKLVLIAGMMIAFAGFPEASAPGPSGTPEAVSARKAPLPDSVRSAMVARGRKDAAKFDRAARREIERLYRLSSSDDPGAAEALKTLEEKFPEANRTGCAVMYAAQRAQGAEREAILKRVIEKYDDCYYGDGVCVGAQARWYLAKLHQAEAEKLLGEIRTRYPDAVTHRGQRFSDFLK